MKSKTLTKNINLKLENMNQNRIKDLEKYM